MLVKLIYNYFTNRFTNVFMNSNKLLYTLRKLKVLGMS